MDVREIVEPEPVEILCGGFPCQPVSVAGKRKGKEDERWLWPEFARVIGPAKPRFVFIENVPGLRTLGLRDVLGDLAELGFDAVWGYFRASDVGAPHRRTRLFLLAYSDCQQGRIQQVRGSRENWEGKAFAGDNGKDWNVANSESIQLDAFRTKSARWQGGSFAASGCDAENGNAAWAAEPDVGRMAHGIPARVDRLRLLGNAVVPQQAALAFQRLLAEIPA